MAHQLLFIQGGGSEGTHDEWDNKLVDSLAHELGHGYEIHYPRMPHEADPGYRAWRAAIFRELSALEGRVFVVGHSIGATILINALGEDHPRPTLAGVFLIAAPFIGSHGWPSDEIEPMDALGSRLPAHVPVHLYHGDEDETAPIEHAALYAKAISHAVVHRLAGRNHQLDGDLTEVAADIRSLA